MEAQRKFGENAEYFQERVRRTENATRVVQSESCYHLFKPHSEKKARVTMNHMRSTGATKVTFLSRLQ